MLSAENLSSLIPGRGVHSLLESAEGGIMSGYLAS